MLAADVTVLIFLLLMVAFGYRVLPALWKSNAHYAYLSGVAFVVGMTACASIITVFAKPSDFYEVFGGGWFAMVSMHLGRVIRAKREAAAQSDDA